MVRTGDVYPRREEVDGFGDATNEGVRTAWAGKIEGVLLGRE
jgi:hypothetical protein